MDSLQRESLAVLLKFLESEAPEAIAVRNAGLEGEITELATWLKDY